MIDQISWLERLKSACAAAQVRLTHTFAVSQIADGAARRHDADGTRRSVAGQIALARRDSRFRGGRHVGMAAALMTDMPHTLAALQRGETTEHRAHLVVAEFGCLKPATRRHADTLIAADLPTLGDLTSRTRAAGIAARPSPARGVQLNLIMTDRTLLGDDDEPAHLIGHEPIPAALARSLVLGHADTSTATFIRRLYTDPTGTRLLTCDARQRLFPDTAKQFKPPAGAAPPPPTPPSTPPPRPATPPPARHHHHPNPHPGPTSHTETLLSRQLLYVA